MTYASERRHVLDDMVEVIRNSQVHDGKLRDIVRRPSRLSQIKESISVVSEVIREYEKAGWDAFAPSDVLYVSYKALETFTEDVQGHDVFESMIPDDVFGLKQSQNYWLVVHPGGQEYVIARSAREAVHILSNRKPGLDLRKVTAIPK